MMMREAPSDHEDRIRALEDSGGGGVTDHGALTGLADDDHPQYVTHTEADADYADIAHDHDADYSDITHDHDADYSAIAHSHALNDLTDVDTTGVADGNVLTFDSGTSEWLPAAPSGGGHTRTTVTVTTGSLADGASEDGTVALPDGARLLKVNVDRACRVRLYVTSATRTADNARSIGTDVDIATNHGLLFEYVASAAIDTYCSPSVDVFQGDGESSVYYRVENRSGSSSTVAVEFDYLRTE